MGVGMAEAARIGTALAIAGIRDQTQIFGALASAPKGRADSDANAPGGVTARGVRRARGGIQIDVAVYSR
jgi:hypothetical protein